MGRALAVAGKLTVAPQTQVLGSTADGEVEIQILDQNAQNMAGAWFEIGDQVVIDPGGAHQETATIGGFGSLIFIAALHQPHASGEIIADVSAAPVAASGVTTTTVGPTVAAPVAAPGTLPRTGSSTRRLLLLAVLTIDAGLVLAIVWRRRRPA